MIDGASRASPEIRTSTGRPANAIRSINPMGTDHVDVFAATVIGFSTVLSLLLSTVAALGVFNTVVLNVRERRRDLGTLKSIGMTPRQTVVMVLASMTVVGVLGGLLAIPLGILAHRYIVPLAADGAGVTIPSTVLDVWQCRRSCCSCSPDWRSPCWARWFRPGAPPG